MNAKEKAKHVLNTFSYNAYNIESRQKYEEAAKILYGDEWKVKVNVGNRMVFQCKACTKDVNSPQSMLDHTNSGNHLKAIDKLKSCFSDENAYKKKTLQSMLSVGRVKAIGLQFVTEYHSALGTQYFKCDLCGAHGKLQEFYLHLIGGKHTDKYLFRRIDAPVTAFLPTTREEHRQFILDSEGQQMEHMKTVKDTSLYPFLWENCVSLSKRPSNESRCRSRTSSLYSEMSAASSKISLAESISVNEPKNEKQDEPKKKQDVPKKEKQDEPKKEKQGHGKSPCITLSNQAIADVKCESAAAAAATATAEVDLDIASTGAVLKRLKQSAYQKVTSPQSHRKKEEVMEMIKKKSPSKSSIRDEIEQLLQKLYILSDSEEEEEYM